MFLQNLANFTDTDLARGRTPAEAELIARRHIAKVLWRLKESYALWPQLTNLPDEGVDEDAIEFEMAELAVAHENANTTDTLNPRQRYYLHTYNTS